MNKIRLCELYQSNVGDVEIKTKTSSKNVISYFLTKISPFFDTMLNKFTFDEKKTKYIDLSSYNENSLDLILRYIYYELDFLEINNEILQKNICEIILLFDFFEIDKPKYLIKYLEEENLDNINIELFYERFKYFDLYFNIFEPIGIRYCNYIINIFKNRIINGICFDKTSTEKYAWCCEHNYKKPENYYNLYKLNGINACICSKLLQRKCKKKVILNIIWRGIILIINFLLIVVVYIKKNLEVK